MENELTVTDIAEKVGISLYYMMHIFKKTTGITVLEFIREAKLTKAKEKLLNTNDNIVTIAQQYGFCSSSYFSKVFTQSEGISPSEYRKLLKVSEV